MLKHIVAFSAKDKKNIATIKQGLAMLGDIPEVKHFAVCDNLKLDALSEEMDVVVYTEFESAEALELFKQHDIYQQCIDIVRPLRDKRVALDFKCKEHILGSNHLDLLTDLDSS